MNMIQLYRVARFFHVWHVPLVPGMIKLFIYLVSNCIVPYTAEIGPESRLAYLGIGVVIHGRSRIGRRVVIGQNVTIGRQLDPETIPTVGDNVYIGPGARILGDISIGHNVIIGANSVVIRSVPSNCIVAGVPAKVVRTVDVDIYRLLKNIYPIDTCNFDVEDAANGNSDSALPRDSGSPGAEDATSR